MNTVLKRRIISNKWIVSPLYDLAFFSGPVLLSFGLVLAFYLLGLNQFLVFLLFLLFFDVPHVFSTFYMVFINRSKEKLNIFLKTCFWYFVGPVIIVVSSLVNTQLPYKLFLLFASLYGSWHIYRQHYGFLSLYQGKNQERAGFDNKEEYYFFHIIFILGVLLVHSRSSELGIKSFVNNSEYLFTIYLALKYLFNAIVIVFVVRGLIKFFIKGRKLNIPKTIFYQSSLALLIYLVNSKLTDQIHFVFFLAIFTIHHNVQYNALVYIYGKKNFSDTSMIRKILTKNFVSFSLCGVFLAIVYKYTVWLTFGSRVPTIFAPLSTDIGSIPLFSSSAFTVQDIALAFFFGRALQHYHIDQKIWKLKSIKDKMNF